MRRYLTGLVVLVALATCTVASGPAPADLDVKKLEPAKKTPREAVGGGEVAATTDNIANEAARTELDTDSRSDGRSG